MSTVLPADLADIAALTAAHELAFYSAHGSALRCAQHAADSSPFHATQLSTYHPAVVWTYRTTVICTNCAAQRAAIQGTDGAAVYETLTAAFD
jgi:hypothetical protein